MHLLTDRLRTGRRGGEHAGVHSSEISAFNGVSVPLLRSGQRPQFLRWKLPELRKIK